MPDSRSERIVFSAGVAAILALLLALIPAYRSYQNSESSESSSITSRSAVGVEAAYRAAEASRSPRRTATPARATPRTILPATAEPKAVRLSLSASRGDCWLEIRERSATGKVLFAGTMEQGKSFKFAASRIWILFGAPENVDLILNGKRAAIPSGTLDVLVTPGGVRTAA
jgi:uncharacterized protein DUF4115